MTEKGDYFVLVKDLRPAKKNQKVLILRARDFLVEPRPGEKKVPFDPTGFRPPTATDPEPRPKYYMNDGDELVRFAILAVNGKLPDCFCFLWYCSEVYAEGYIMYHAA